MGTWSLLVVLLISCAASLAKKCPSNILMKFLSNPSKAKEHYDNGETISVTCLADSGEDGYDYSNDDGSDGLDTNNIRVLNCTDGKWIGHYPECFSNCTKPDIFAILNPEYEVYAPGDNVTITACKKDNARIEGNTTLICMADGTWIGSARCPKQHRSCNKQPTTISNAYITDAVLDEYKHGTVLRYKCSQAFDQMEKYSVTCNDGQWIPDSANLLRCIIGHCSHIDSREISNMHVKKISGQVGTYAEFECYDGYELDGSARILCMADRKWYPEIPKCKPISCPPPKQILNGRLIQEAYNGVLNIYQSTIRYDCDMGYRIVGPRFRKCQSDRTWSGNDTKCEEIVCEIPSPPENGTVYLTDNSQKVGSQIEYICDEHHIMEPIASKFAICTVHGHWSSPQPRCIKICNVSALSHGSINGRKIAKDSYVLDNTELIFTCYKGYEKYASGYETWGRLKCVNYTLHPGSPDCRPQRCFIEPPINLEYFIGQEKVLENYIHSGTEMNARCSNRTELFNFSSYLEREHVSVKCNFGKLEPESTVCKDKRCDIVTIIDNGQFRNRGKVVVTGEKIISGSNITLKCSEGYELYNKTNSVYLDLQQTDIKCYQGSFTTAIPSCEPKRCFIELRTNLEYFDGEEKILENYIHSGIGMNIRCSNRTELFRSSSYLEREQVYVKCSLGKLESESPVCMDKRCDIITTIDNGQFKNRGKVVVTGEKIISGNNITLKCSEGYELYNKTNSVYLDLEQTDIKCYQGSFTTEIPSCEPKRCNIITTIDNGLFRNSGKVVVTGEKILSGSNIKLICLEEYQLYNKTNSMYLDLEHTDIKCYQGSFTPEIPSCEPKRCLIEPPVNMQYFIEGKKVLHKYIVNGTIMQARCPDRMQLVLSSSYLDNEQTIVQCILGTLEPRTLECKGKMCKTIDVAREITGFIVSETKTTPGEFVPHNQSIQIVCGEGYRPYGILTCNAGIWMGNSTCELGCVLKDPGMHFISLGNRTVLNVGENANVSCKFGYQIVSNISATPADQYHYDASEVSDGNYTCRDSGKWEPEIRFSCEQMCKTIDVARNITGFIVNETKTTPGEFVPHNQSIQTVCGEGYRQHGILTCNAGKWMGNSTCEPDVTGCVLKDPGMHFISLGNRTVLKVGEKANVSCKFGYEIVPNISAKGSYEYNYPDSESTADPSEMPETEENENRIAVSDGNYTCIDNGKWEPELRFSCKQMCKTIDVARNITGFIVNETKTTPGEFVPHNQSIQTVCVEGYRQHGILTCNAGKWMGNSTCEPDVTGCVLKDPGMHFISLGNRTVLKVGEKANVSCKFGYEIVPNISAKGSYEYNYPDSESTADPSEMPETEDNENLIAVSDGNYTCIDNGKWEPELRFSCKQIMCDSFEKYNLENGNIIDSTHGVDTVGTVVSFQCNPGYTRHGPETRTCQTDGTWSGKCVTCQMDGRNASITCPAPCVPEGARKTGSHTYEKGSTVKFHCPRSKTQDRDYRRNIRHCIIKDEYVSWNGTQINCKEIICDKGDHYGFENGIVTYSSSSAYVSTVASFRCNPGYKRRGPKTRICQKDGTWSGECVTCQKHQPSSSTCPAPCVPDGAIKIGSRSYEIGSIIQLYCFQSNMNYNVQNSYIRHCVNDGKSASWNGTNINCKVKCEPLTDTYNVVQTGVVPGILSDKTIVELNCNGSLAPVKAECRKGHWHPKKPTCKYTCSLSAVEGTLYKYNVAKDQVFLDAIESGRQIKVTCEDGFLPNTQNYDVSSCVNGVWKPEIVKCNKT